MCSIEHSFNLKAILSIRIQLEAACCFNLAANVGQAWRSLCLKQVAGCFFTDSHLPWLTCSKNTSLSPLPG
jgi:hypothetical protein